MTTSGTVLATSIAQHWHNFWRGEIGDWILNRGLRIVMLLIAAAAPLPQPGPGPTAGTYPKSEPPTR